MTVVDLAALIGGLVFGVVVTQLAICAYDRRVRRARRELDAQGRKRVGL